MAAKLSQGVMAPGFLPEARRAIAQPDVVWIHVPQLEAAALVHLATRIRKPCVVTCHTDVVLPPGAKNQAISALLRRTHRFALARADAVVSYTQSYADASPMLVGRRDRLRVIAPPVEVVLPSEATSRDWRAATGTGDRKIIGICARLAPEKGFE